MTSTPPSDNSQAVMMSRRQFLRTAGGALATGAAAVSLGSFVVEPRWLDAPTYPVPVAGLRPGLEGYTIAHLTDLHMRGIGVLHDQIVRVLTERKPDLVVLTGDMVEAVAYLRELSRFVRRLPLDAAPVVATLGNWEHSSPELVDYVAKLYAGFGVRLLVNENTTLDCGIAIAGTDDSATENHDIARTLAGLPATGPRLLLTHAPGIFDEFPHTTPPFDLALAGHTHAGQVRFGPWAPVVPAGSGPYVKGFYAAPCGRAYVSRGLGTTMIPVRLMCRPELPFFRLTRAEH